MTKLRTRIAIAIVATAAVGGWRLRSPLRASTGHGTASTTTTTTTLAAPVQANAQHHVFFNVDTVQGGGGTVKLAADAACSMTNLFQRGNVVVFRMYGVHVSTGANLTNVTVKSAWVKVPGLPKMPMYYSNHPTKPVVAYWTAAWPVKKSYPLGGRELHRHGRHQPDPRRGRERPRPVRGRRLHRAGHPRGRLDADDRAQLTKEKDSERTALPHGRQTSGGRSFSKRREPVTTV